VNVNVENILEIIVVLFEQSFFWSNLRDNQNIQRNASIDTKTKTTDRKSKNTASKKVLQNVKWLFE